MPYTPPAHHSPASTNHHYFDHYAHHGQHLPVQSPFSNGSKHLPRSRSSSTASRTRHEEEVIKNTVANTAQLSHVHAVAGEERRLNIDTSLRQSPPPVTDSIMPAGALMSPPDSGHVSSDEEGAKPSHNETSGDIEELEKAVRESLQINRKGSPEMDTAFQFPLRNDGSASSADSGKLSPSARKIAHSRSSTDTAIVLSPAPQSPSNASVSDGSDEDADKPPLIRKKSGELVKPAIRPRSRRTASSMPGTPTYGKKGVHFNDDLQQVKHFLQVDRPIAVSAGGSPTEHYEEDKEFPFGRLPPSPSQGLDLRLGNFPRRSLERQSQPVRLDKLTLSGDGKSLIGFVVVANLAFHKHVAARFTFDSWKTTSEVAAAYNTDASQKPSDGYDLFKFSIKLSDHTNLERKTMLICIRYCVSGQDYWDNNNSANFQVEFNKKSAQSDSAAGLGARPIPRSRRDSIGPGRPHSMPLFDEDFSRNFDNGPGIKLKQPPRGSNLDVSQPRRTQPANQQFGTRYDFGASLTAALNHAQSNLSNRSGPKAQEATQSRGNTGSGQERPKSNISNLQRHTPTSTTTESPRADTLHANRSSLDSRAYQEFVSKFCFFGSGKQQGNTSSVETTSSTLPKKEPSTGYDGASDERPEVPVRAPDHSLAQHETISKRVAKSKEHSSSPLSPRLSAGTGGTRSPPLDFGSPHTYGSGTASPVPLDYGLGQASNFLSSGATTPATAIQG